MPVELPPAALLKLEQTLAQWQHWRGAQPLPGAPHVVGTLAGGISNYNVLVQAAGQRFVVRLDRASPGANGLSRQAEWRALASAHRAGIAPRPRYYNPDLGALVCDYLEPDAGQVPTVAALSELLRRIHALPSLHFRMDPLERMRRYERQLPDEQQGLLALGDAIRARDSDDGAALCLCHHDLSPANLLLSQGRLYALDWEYCAMGNPWFDLAVVADGCKLRGDAVEQLLRGYLGRPATAADRRALHEQSLIARYLELLWYASGQGCGATEEAVAPRARELAALLELNPGSC